MIINLFSIFDPSSHIWSAAWGIIFIIIRILRTKIWNLQPTAQRFKKKIIGILKKEVKFTLNEREAGRQTIIILVFLLIILINFTALYPQIFSATSHLTVTLPLSLTFWLGLIIFGWIKNTNHILSHLVPQGTPSALIMFMVLIELVRNLIRPITLCVRLTANLIAGHLLISLLGNFLININITTTILAFSIPVLLTILETAVAFIQAYVFMTLITLYTTEVK
jgi:F-type H+-transporting ATPase subunit a